MISKRFTPEATLILTQSRSEAIRLNNDHVMSAHLLLAIIESNRGEALRALHTLDVDVHLLRQQLEESAREQASPIPYDTEDLIMDQTASKIMKLSVLESQVLHSEVIGDEHLLLALLREGKNDACRLLADQHVTYADVHDALFPTSEDPTDYDEEDEEDEDDVPTTDYHGRSTQSHTVSHSKNGTPALDNFGTDLTEAAREGLLDPVVGREHEIERVAQILSRRKKNNPILIGEPGVGKSAIVEGLAQRIVNRKISRILWDKRVVMLDMGSVVAGTKYRGQFEERIRNIITELQNNPDIIIFIDEIHTIIGAGNAQGTMDAANLLKPALARGQVQCIGATTIDEYRKTIEKDGALERRFQKVMVQPTTAEETLQILQNLRERYEEHHHVMYTDDALQACVRLTERYVTDRSFPDKAIDVLDEAGSRVHIKYIPIDPEVEKLESDVAKYRSLKENAVKNQNFELAADYRDQLKQKEAEYAEKRKAWEESLNDDFQQVDADQVAGVVSMMTGIPVARIGSEDNLRLRQLGQTLASQVIGQDEAIRQLAQAIKRSRVGLKDPKKPIGTFMFVGPTGVGKTYLAKKLAEEMFGTEEALIRIDMSEYMEKHTVSRMVGAPPGYVGYDEGGQLTEKVRRKPYSIVLLDEIEKAHPDVFNLLLQVMDDGRLTDGNGVTIDFRNTIIIMTSNCGTRQLKEFGQGVGFSAGMDASQDRKLAHDLVEKTLKKQFAPEFLNRLDDVIYFDQLSIEAIKQIVDIELKPLQKRVLELGYTLELTDPAKELLAKKGYDVQYGARPLHRALQTLIEDPLSELILNGDKPAGSVIKVHVEEGNLKLL